MIEWHQSDTGQVFIKASKKKFQAKKFDKKRKRSEGGRGNSKTNGGTGGDEINKTEKARLQNEYQAAVVKVAKKLVTSSIEARKLECDAGDASLEVAIKRCAMEVSATSVVSNAQVAATKEVVAKKVLAKKYTVPELLSVVFRINKEKRAVTFKEG